MIDHSLKLGDQSRELDAFLEYVRRVRPGEGNETCRRYACLDTANKVHSFAYHVVVDVADRSPVYRELLRFARRLDEEYAVAPSLARDEFFVDDLKYSCGELVDDSIRDRLHQDPRYRMIAPKGLRVLRAWRELVMKEVIRARQAR